MAKNIHATQDWTSQKITEALENYTPSGGGGDNGDYVSSVVFNTFSDDVNNRIDYLNNETSDAINFLEKYGTTNVYVLQPGIDVTVDETGTVITGTVSGEVLDLSDYDIVVVPEGITEITSSQGTYITAKKLILPSTCTYMIYDPINSEELVLSEGAKTLGFTMCTMSCDIYLPSSLTIFDVNDSTIASTIYCNEKSKYFKYIGNTDADISGKIYFPESISKIELELCHNTNFGLYVYNPNATLIIENNNASDDTPVCINVYSYAGSNVENTIRNYSLSIPDYMSSTTYNFNNIGSDCSIFVYNFIATEATLSANEYYSFTDISSLTVTLDTASTTRLDEFMFSFETPADVSTFSFGVLTDEGIEIKWIKEPSLKANYIYEVSIVNGVGVIAGTAKEVA